MQPICQKKIKTSTINVKLFSSPAFSTHAILGSIQASSLELHDFACNNVLPVINVRPTHHPVVYHCVLQL